MLLDTPTQGNLLANVCACGARQHQFCSLLLDGRDPCTSRGRTKVHHQHLLLCQLPTLCLLSIRSLNTQQPTKQVVVDFDFDVDVRQTTLQAKDESNQTISSAKSR